jgi:hypothetical protein
MTLNIRVADDRAWQRRIHWTGYGPAGIAQRTRPLHSLDIEVQFIGGHPVLH